MLNSNSHVAFSIIWHPFCQNFHSDHYDCSYLRRINHENLPGKHFRWGYSYFILNRLAYLWQYIPLLRIRILMSRNEQRGLLSLGFGNDYHSIWIYSLLWILYYPCMCTMLNLHIMSFLTKSKTRRSCCPNPLP